MMDVMGEGGVQHKRSRTRIETRSSRRKKEKRIIPREGREVPEQIVLFFIASCLSTAAAISHVSVLFSVSRIVD